MCLCACVPERVVMRSYLCCVCVCVPCVSCHGVLFYAAAFSCTDLRGVSGVNSGSGFWS